MQCVCIALQDIHLCIEFSSLPLSKRESPWKAVENDIAGSPGRRYQAVPGPAGFNSDGYFTTGVAFPRGIPFDFAQRFGAGGSQEFAVCYPCGGVANREAAHG